MRRLFTLVLAFAAFADTGARAAEPALRVSGPHVHENLTIYFLHGPSAPGPVPLTLAEAMARNVTRVYETGSVNSLQVENTGTEPVFIRAGDIVKGGQQDRVLTLSLLLPPRSGKVAIGSFCVEQGRWSARGAENVKQFASSAEALPSRTAKLAMASPQPSAAPAPAAVGLTAGVGNRVQEQRIARGAAPDATADKQRKVWDEVASIQRNLAAKLGGNVQAKASESSLQLTLENERLSAARAAYIDALAGKATGQDDIVGFAVAIDGKIATADVYPSNGLFRKMWDKGLAASVTEALTVGSPTTPATQPTAADVDAFIRDGEAGKAHEARVADLVRQETRDAAKVISITTQGLLGGAILHRNYLAK